MRHHCNVLSSRTQSVTCSALSHKAPLCSASSPPFTRQEVPFFNYYLKNLLSLYRFLHLGLFFRHEFSRPISRCLSGHPTPERIWCSLTGSFSSSRFRRWYAGVGAMVAGSIGRARRARFSAFTTLGTYSDLFTVSSLPRVGSIPPGMRRRQGRDTSRELKLDGGFFRHMRSVRQGVCICKTRP